MGSDRAPPKKETAFEDLELAAGDRPGLFLDSDDMEALAEERQRGQSKPRRPALQRAMVLAAMVALTAGVTPEDLRLCGPEPKTPAQQQAALERQAVAARAVVAVMDRRVDAARRQLEAAQRQMERAQEARQKAQRRVDQLEADARLACPAGQRRQFRCVDETFSLGDTRCDSDGCGPGPSWQDNGCAP